MIPGVDQEQWAPASPSINAHHHGGPSARGLSSSGLNERQKVRQRLGNQRIFLYMGRVSTEKNVEALLKGWKLVNPAGCTLVIVGDGPLRATLQYTHTADNVVWWGYEINLDTRVALLQEAEVFVLPSLVEGLSIACWKPCPVAAPA